MTIVDTPGVLPTLNVRAPESLPCTIARYWRGELWERDIIAEMVDEPGFPQPGRDCPACPADRGEHTGWGCVRTGCRLSVALITQSLYRRTT